MDHEFWHNRWQQGQIGFHQNEVNPFLQTYWPEIIGDRQGCRVFVPLCGKTLDMAWLSSLGHYVIGVELNESAVAALFAEQSLPYQRRQQGEWLVYENSAMQVWVGDFFKLTAAKVSDCRAIYDRAALIALPEPMRQQYLAHINMLLPHAKQLLITMEYDEARYNGPPFSISKDQVFSYSKARAPRCLHSHNLLAAEKRWQERGMSFVWEHVFALSALP